MNILISAMTIIIMIVIINISPIARISAFPLEIKADIGSFFF